MIKIFTYCRLYSIYRRKRYRRGFFRIFNKKFFFNDSASFVSMYKSIFINESYKFKTFKLNPLIMVCGANIGLSVLYFKKLYPNCIIQAFEPDKKIFDLLKLNCRNFNLKDVTIINQGVWKKNSFAYFLPDGADGGKIISQKYKKLLRKILVTRLKDLLVKGNKIDLLKIDIEGAETDVLIDCRNNLSGVKLLFVEYHSLSKSTQKLDKILKILRKAGFKYHVYSIATPPKSPFLNRLSNGDFDLQLNIYAYRDDGTLE